MTTDKAVIAERSRMALAELGWPGEAIYQDDGGTWRWSSALVPEDVMWRARSTAGHVQCFTCWNHVNNLARAGLDARHEDVPCASMAPFTSDCGVDRT